MDSFFTRKLRAVGWFALSIDCPTPQGNGNNRIVQAVTVCPGASYQLSYQYARMSGLATITITAIIGDTLIGTTIAITQIG